MTLPVRRACLLVTLLPVRALTAANQTISQATLRRGPKLPRAAVEGSLAAGALLELVAAEDPARALKASSARVTKDGCNVADIPHSWCSTSKGSAAGLPSRP
jgi:hypothetical protein